MKRFRRQKKLAPGPNPTGFEGLKYYVRHFDDKNPPPYFAGRGDIISGIEDACMESWSRHCNGQTQNKPATRLIYGAPGAGKTSTLLHLRDEWDKGLYITRLPDGSKRPGPAPMMLCFTNDGQLHYAHHFCKVLVNFVAPKEGDGMFALSTHKRRRFGTFRFPWLTSGGEHEVVDEYQRQIPGMEAVARVLTRDKWKRPIVIGIDETQNLPGERNSVIGTLLRELHDNDFNLPITVVLAGLSDSKIRASEMGLTRFIEGSVRSLSCFNESELAELKAGFCRHYEIELGRCENQFDLFLEATDGWPCHLQNGLRAFAEIYIEAGGDIKQVDFVEVDKRIKESRNRYYHSRMSNEMYTSGILLASLMQQLTGEQNALEVRDIIKSTIKPPSEQVSIGEGLPDGMSVMDYYEHLIHQGALQQYDDGVVNCPIPSFRRFLIELFAEYRRTLHQRDVIHYRELPLDEGGIYLSSDDREQRLH